MTPAARALPAAVRRAAGRRRRRAPRCLALQPAFADRRAPPLGRPRRRLRRRLVPRPHRRGAGAARAPVRRPPLPPRACRGRRPARPGAGPLRRCGGAAGQYRGHGRGDAAGGRGARRAGRPARHRRPQRQRGARGWRGWRRRHRCCWATRPAPRSIESGAALPGGPGGRAEDRLVLRPARTPRPRRAAGAGREGARRLLPHRRLRHRLRGGAGPRTSRCSTAASTRWPRRSRPPR